MSQHQHYRHLALIAAMALFMQSLDATILNTALPAISASLNESPLEMQMTIISYSLTVALFIPLTGWVADKYGTLNVFRVAVGIFVLGSVVCAMANSLNALIWSRILQGFGGALMMPVARLVIIRHVPKTQLVAAWNAMAMAGLSLGYNRHGKWLRSGLNSNEWLVSSLARNPSKLPTKYLGNGCGICSLSECQEDKIKKPFQFMEWFFFCNIKKLSGEIL